MLGTQIKVEELQNKVLVTGSQRPSFVRSLQCKAFVKIEDFKSKGEDFVFKGKTKALQSRGVPLLMSATFNYI